MNSPYQVMLVALIVALAVMYLIRLAKRSASSRGCGGNCDCHRKKKKDRSSGAES
jgi:FeoB-associated Cys-rich membrane protein